MADFGTFYLDKEKDVIVELRLTESGMRYLLRTPNHAKGNLITNLARLCRLPLSVGADGLKVIEGEVPCYIDERNREVYVLRLADTKVANIYPDGEIERKAYIPAISKTLMSQTKDYRLDERKTLVKTYIRREYKFRTDLHTHMNANLDADVLMALGIFYQIRYPLYYIKKLGLRCTDAQRKAELRDMADRLNRVIDKPCESYHDALQACFLYQLGILLDSQPHGISYGRLDQYCGKYLEKDLAEGKLTRAQAQELTDMFILKVAEINKAWSERATRSSPGYTSGQLITLGGTDKEGRDVTNDVTYMVMQASARLKIHNPPLALRLHEGTPDELWEAGIETTKQVGGVPCFEWDGVAEEALMRRGIPLEDARNYCLIGCVEPCVCGSDFANSGGDGANSYTILPAVLWCAINNGCNPWHARGTPERRRTGPATGYRCWKPTGSRSNTSPSGRSPWSTATNISMPSGCPCPSSPPRWRAAWKAAWT